MSIIADTGVGDGLMAIASGLMGIALIALILNRSSDASSLIQTGGSTFGSLLNTVMLNGGGSFGSIPRGR